MKIKQKFLEVFDFIEIIRQECKSASLEDCYNLMKIASALHHFNEVDCNIGLSKWQGSRRVTLETQAHLIVQKLGIDFHFNRDPRGPSLLLKLPSGKTNDWGRRGHCVPEL